MTTAIIELIKPVNLSKTKWRTAEVSTLYLAPSPGIYLCRPINDKWNDRALIQRWGPYRRLICGQSRRVIDHSGSLSSIMGPLSALYRPVSQPVSQWGPGTATPLGHGRNRHRGAARYSPLRNYFSSFSPGKRWSGQPISRSRWRSCSGFEESVGFVFSKVKPLSTGVR